ncbi:MAG: [FeFe] hydrogenase H-cluster maturation GTPase HydF [bacterium]
METAPRGTRMHIAIFGRRNAGKSSLINALTDQEVAIVSSVAGTTTDPVFKSMEILPIGPCVLIDTAGIDDVGELGSRRIERTMWVLRKTDIGIIVVDPESGFGEYEHDLLEKLQRFEIPAIGVINKVDVHPEVALLKRKMSACGLPVLEVSALKKHGVDELKKLIIENEPKEWIKHTVLGDIISAGDVVVLVVPIDSSAPKNRIILPQVQAIRDVLDHNAITFVTKETELSLTLQKLKQKPKIVITDSQAVREAVRATPPDVLFTTFSILFARYKGDLNTLVDGAAAIRELRPGDSVLIAEACTHHTQAEDIGKVKIPRWLRQFAGGDLNFNWLRGGDFSEDLSPYKLIVHCGACMINRKEMLYRISRSQESGVPIVNYGVLIACVNGYLHRALSPFPELQVKVDTHLKLVL